MPPGVQGWLATGPRVAAITNVYRRMVGYYLPCMHMEGRMTQWLSYRGVSEKTTFSESTIRRLVAQGKFPAPVKLSRARVAFSSEDVERAMQALVCEHNRPTEAA